MSPLTFFFSFQTRKDMTSIDIMAEILYYSNFWTLWLIFLIVGVTNILSGLAGVAEYGPILPD